MTSSNVSLTTEQKTTIRNTVINTGPKVTNVNFDIRVGTVVPRTVPVAPVPVTLVEIQPAWRGYMYFVYADEIIIVEPGTLADRGGDRSLVAIRSKQPRKGGHRPPFWHYARRTSAITGRWSEMRARAGGRCSSRRSAPRGRQ